MTRRKRRPPAIIKPRCALCKRPVYSRGLCKQHRMASATIIWKAPDLSKMELVDFK